MAELGGSLIETPKAFTSGEGDIAEQSAAGCQAIVDGRSRARGLLADHREAPPDTDMPDECVLHDPPCAPGWSPIERLTPESFCAKVRARLGCAA
ncbi:hypothetical protein ACFYWX_34775 [Streptomyces sp. NPDC002888]|uniref:hypothetical protein n=1 Tax=Streptomyces sp. NPDC002888 TaxID=3364668 RepID=UPI0036AB3110